MRLRTLVLLAMTAAVCAAQQGQQTADYYDSLKVEVVAKDLNHSEGPVWSRQGFLYFSDWGDNRIYKYVPGKGVTVFRDDEVGPNGSALDRQGRLYNCEYIARRPCATALSAIRISKRST